MKKSIFISTVFSAFICWSSALKATLNDSYENQQKSWQQHQNLINNSDFKSMEWRNIGPVIQGGRVVAVRSSNQNDNILYLAYASGGVWKSVDKGITFAPITDTLPSQIVGSFAVDPNNDNILWLGTGENNSSRSSYAGMGVFRSDDAGQSWSHVGLGDTNRIGDILVDPKNSNRVYVAALGPLYSEGGDRGVFVSEDSGQSWKKTLSGDKKTGFVDLSLASNGDIYASAWQRMRSSWNFEEGGKGSKLYKSSDNGQTWSELTNGLPQGDHVGRMGVDVAPSNPNIVYVSVDNQELLPESDWDLGDSAMNPKRLKKMSKQEFLTLDKKEIEGFLKSNKFPPETTADKIIEDIKTDKITVNDLVKSLKDANDNLFNSDIKGLEIYRSDNAGASFYKTHEQPLSNIVFTYGYYFGTMRVDPNDENTIYTMGVPLVKSKDGGKTWVSLYDPKVHVDYQDLWIDPKNSNHIIAANDGGADESYDQGDNWRKLDYQPVGQFYTVAVDMQKPYNVYGGLQDNGTLKGASTTDWKDGESWKQLFGGDGMNVSVDKEDTVYVGFQFGNNFKLKDGVPKSIKPPNFINEEPLRYNWNTPVILSSHNNDIIYYGANKLFRSFDQGDTWKAISKDLTQSFKRGDVPYATITSISESPIDFGRIIVGTDDGMIWVTDDDGKSWKNVTKKLPKKLWVSRVVASKYDADTLWLTLNNYRNDDIKSYVYRSTDFGNRWQDISNNLPNFAVNVIKEDPKTQELIYLGTDKGVYFSNDAGAKWQALGSEFPTVPVHDLIVHPRENELVVATHGRSMWITDVTPIQDYNDYKDKPLAVLAVDEIKFNNTWNSRPSRWFNPDNEKQLSKFKIWSKKEGESNISVLNDEDQILFETSLKLQKGLNIWKWDNLLDIEKAKAAEALKIKDAEPPINKSLTPVSEGLRLGHDIYIQKGKYKIQVILGETKETKEFEVK
jgi:photosystem II stability/assembly factor-like uncharacterized protein